SEGLAIAALAVRIHAHERARYVLANEQTALGVIGHPVALVARVRNLGDALCLAPASRNVSGHVADEQGALVLVPQRSLSGCEARRELLDLGLRVDQLRELLRLDVNGHLGSFARGGKPAETTTVSARKLRFRAGLGTPLIAGNVRGRSPRTPIGVVLGGWDGPRAAAPQASPPVCVR